ncbi:Rap1a/Tai family immunity protein [Commensalibacter papalotli (ex Servin-Garciduenas et al. 2014)]|uniref:Rap1a immunity protein domain-containing protein n=1 Tax=Commensalibacter papalotli (ex Servin-Garciduenas et al. 2014) TaxID=1208583 RepID=W7DX51_9PROT|nr:Rap1a/Tai family immunity protein [Commensalibacter papalotli (ex Servin-Garciduenas et al. 2014)]EUK18773.1 hypothetical protein COMX_03455 [Commensalibacter papalotli (ex Servin-Garciduenas et al. 2014)]
MNTKRALLLAGFGLMVIFATPNAMAQRVTQLQAGKFLQYCKNPKALKLCDAYISGISDSVAYSKMFAKNQGDVKSPAGFCIATNISGKEMRDKVIAWMDGHSDKLTQPAGAAVFTALHDAYPCNPNQNGKK